MASKTPIQSSIVIESKPSGLREPCERLLSLLEEKGYAQDDLFAVHLALEEAFLNAVKHGNKMDPSKKVVLEYLVDEEKVEIRMTDEGRGFDPHRIPDPRMGENLYRPEGRGLLLMNAYMDVVEYNERGNGLRMVRYKKRPFPGRPHAAET
ncbi:MAG: ATP-binding protein [Planctomycetaceae bacterium]|nr:MAG: ATP-binding protein [Planctomycetaceae bacterium]